MVVGMHAKSMASESAPRDFEKNLLKIGESVPTY